MASKSKFLSTLKWMKWMRNTKSGDLFTISSARQEISTLKCMSFDELIYIIGVLLTDFSYLLNNCLISKEYFTVDSVFEKLAQRNFTHSK